MKSSSISEQLKLQKQEIQFNEIRILNNPKYNQHYLLPFNIKNKEVSIQFVNTDSHIVLNNITMLLSVLLLMKETSKDQVYLFLRPPSAKESSPNYEEPKSKPKNRKKSLSYKSGLFI